MNGPFIRCYQLTLIKHLIITLHSQVSLTPRKVSVSIIISIKPLSNPGRQLSNWIDCYDAGIACEFQRPKTMTMVPNMLGSRTGQTKDPSIPEHTPLISLRVCNVRTNLSTV
ncbi:hypothetical protein HBI70_187910 [Parastagonospora nodorum]|nr:hypothetical protein HBH53_213020 [Parastagonospora nodorum]KAH4183844.1 hypothetical protein HBH42_199800 [Parastagonospora nodorum]KAH4268921.1 hypothetical protein HBI03_053130 [Parastagonospora nodorum]KAH4280443.1 hypothetical protein HBI04_060780 [Parastagonospora nodorum]KAH4600421.1 hypothetical protein HBH82_190730 [Parastagonospora nodorum]